MAHLFRLICAVLVAVFCLWSGAASASVPKQSGYNVDGVAGGPYATRELACAGVLAIRRAAAPTRIYRDASISTVNQCSFWWKANATASEQNEVWNLSVVAGVCPVNSTVSGSACSCTSPYIEDATHTSCVAPPNECVQKMGSSDGLWKYDGGYGAQPNSLASEICKQSSGGVRCVVKVSNPKCTQGRLQGVGSPYWYCKGEAFYTGGYGVGGACDRNTSAGGDGGSAGSLPEVTIKPPPDELPPNTAAPSSCPQGTFEGTVNGTHTCVEDIGSPTAGQSPQTGQNTNQNADGSTTTTTTTGTTVCANGSCTTTNNVASNITNNPASTCPAGTTPSGPGGSASSCTGTKASSTTEAQSEFCKSHPEDKQCGGKEGGGFAGSCAGGFVATGEDPILNAMAKEQYTRNCEILRTDTEPSTWAAAEGAKTDNAMKDNPNNSTATIGPSNFDMGDSLGGGGCNLNRTVVVRGYSVALPFNVLCNPLAVLGQILVAVSLLLAARIVTRG